MASYEQVIKFEGEKPEGVIRLVEANGFYRAYNQSAYLFHQAIAQHKVTRKFVSSLGVLSHDASSCVRKVAVGKSRLSELGSVSDDGLRFYPRALEWKLKGTTR